MESNAIPLSSLPSARIEIEDIEHVVQVRHADVFHQLTYILPAHGGQRQRVALTHQEIGGLRGTTAEKLWAANHPLTAHDGSFTYLGETLDGGPLNLHGELETFRDSQPFIHFLTSHPRIPSNCNRSILSVHAQNGGALTQNGLVTFIVANPKYHDYSWNTLIPAERLRTLAFEAMGYLHMNHTLHSVSHRRSKDTSFSTVCQHCIYQVYQVYQKSRLPWQK